MSHRTEVQESVVVRFAGDSGDGMQLTGSQFTLASVFAGNDVATFPDYPAEIRAPAGTLAGVSGFQLHFAAENIHTSGDAIDVLVAMNPAALASNIAGLLPNGLLIVNSDSFAGKGLRMAGYQSNPLEDDSLGDYQLFAVGLGRLTSTALADFDLSAKEVERCKNFFALSGVQKAMAKRGIPSEQVAIVSGIGCSSRFPYYMSTYGFHTIHGRAPAIATGLKIARPDMNVWVITGDGDALSIGGNHFIHVIRRNVDLKVLLFNNRIYGLTKGQYSPTSEVGKRTKSSPEGSVDNPFNPISVAIGSEASFIARTIDVDAKVMAGVLAAAAEHTGTAFVEVLQNCNIFNDGAWEDLSARAVRADRTILLQHGEPMIFGANRDKGIRLKGLRPEVVTLGEDGITADDLWVHDAHDPDSTRAFFLSRMNGPDYPVPVGVLRAVERPVYDRGLNRQVDHAQATRTADLEGLLAGRRSWLVE